MATYAVGDLQGCLDPLLNLLEQVNFGEQDKLWLAGDLVNRGPQSLQTLRFVKALKQQAVVVLGNHDLHLLALYHRHNAANNHSNSNNNKNSNSKHLTIDPSLASIFAANDLTELMVWLQAQPLLHYDAKMQAVMTHAGIPPCWDLDQAQALADEIHKVLMSDQAQQFFARMYGNQPNQWQDSLTGDERWRCITNFFTRMRFLDQQGGLELATKSTVDNAPSHLIPWFLWPTQVQAQQYFGHWAALQGNTGLANITSLDMGYVWGGQLKMVCLDNQQVYTCAYPASQELSRP